MILRALFKCSSFEHFSEHNENLSPQIQVCIPSHETRPLDAQLIEFFKKRPAVKPKKNCIYFFQNGIVSAIPFLCMYIIGIAGGQLADWLRFNHILSTGEVRKVFATGGECIRCATSRQKLEKSEVVLKTQVLKHQNLNINITARIFLLYNIIIVVLNNTARISGSFELHCYFTHTHKKKSINS